MFHHSAPTRPLVQRLAIILAVVVQIGAGVLPQWGIGEPIGERSNAVRTLITPAGWAFAIWGPLFVLSALFAVWQALPAQRNSALLNRIAWPAALALALQGVWSAYAQIDNLTAVSVLIILASLTGLLLVLRTLVAAPRLSPAERLFAAPAFSALAAWLTAASVVNIAATLRFYGIGGGDPAPLVAVAIVAIASAVAVWAVAQARGAPLYGLVFCYALIGINASGGQRFGIIGWACLAGIVAVLATAVWRLSNADNRRHWLGGQARPTLT